MAPLYKRYVPPKVTEAPVIAVPAAASNGLYKRYIPPKASDAPAVKAVATANGEDGADGERKRKRERPEDEVAERKAKKMRKKGVEVPVTQKKKHVKQVAPPAEVQTPVVQDSVPSENAIKEANGDFGHVKNVKKRHKLEKEARKARKAAEKVGGGEVGGNGPEQAEGASGLDALSPAATPDEQPKETQAEARTEDHVVQVQKPKKKRRDDARERSVERSHDDEAVPAITAASEQASTPNKDRKKRSRKSEESYDSHIEQNGPPADQAKGVQEPQVEQAENAEPMEVDIKMPTEPEPAPSKLKKRRHRLEAVLAQTNGDAKTAGADADAQPDEDDAHLRKHGAVLSKFQKAAKVAATTADKSAAADEDEPAQDPVILRDLIPLPQLEKAATPDFVPQHSALPPWLAKPTVISNDSKATFSALGLDPKTVEHLSQLGFTDALPVQQALIPLLLPPGIPGASFLPGTEPVLPDLAVSAATGSGKTIAYLLPIIEALKRGGHGNGRLKAVVVVPTRELVTQVAGVAEGLVKGSGLRIGTAVGSGKLREEQEKLVRRSQKYDPEGYAVLLKKADKRNYPAISDSDAEGESEDEEEEDRAEEDQREAQRANDAVTGLIDHVPTYLSAVDILICTPGRLIEHLNTTLGFTLSFLQYLVLDEADKLLDQQYDGFLETINTALSSERSAEEQDLREVYLRRKGCWDEQRERRVRKVVLSATMTADVAKLAGLRLVRAKMVVVRGSSKDGGDGLQAVSGATEAESGVGGVKEVGEGFELPPTLVEYCVPIGEGGEKGLVLVRLLEERIMPRTLELESGVGDADEDSESDLDSTESSVLSESSEEPSSDEDSDGEEDSSDAASSDAEEEVSAKEDTGVHPDRAALFAPKPKAAAFTGIPTVLIFTSTTESASRLAHLLKQLKPEWAPWISSLTKTTATAAKSSASNNNNSSEASGLQQPSITISTDRAARGLDSLQGGRAITHVLQYDVPRSVSAYVHRVGRTARAGHGGEAWTLYGYREARWFLREVCGVVATGKDDRRGPVSGVIGARIGRVGVVEKVRVEGEEGLRGAYEGVLEGMREEVWGGKRGG
ncbi:hypothetical protein LTR08_000914 [Meristemomyces frigidus]|nr:hypothetical protein LTR08_000914 [Meristemomyces frigidus]